MDSSEALDDRLVPNIREPSSFEEIGKNHTITPTLDNATAVDSCATPISAIPKLIAAIEHSF